MSTDCALKNLKRSMVFEDEEIIKMGRYCNTDKRHDLMRNEARRGTNAPYTLEIGIN